MLVDSELASDHQPGLGLLEIAPERVSPQRKLSFLLELLQVPFQKIAP